MTLREITEKLLEEGVATKCGKVKWSATTIQSILKNEKYCGDAILQKTITIDCIEKVHKKNEGEAPMYYVRDNHPAIVSRKTFNKAQEEMARRGSKRSPSQKGSVTGQGKYSKYALSEVLHCGTCGTKYRRTTWCKNGKKRVVWRCCSRLDYGTQFCKDSPTVDETELHAAIVRAMSTFNKEDYDIFHQSILDTMPDAIGLFEDTSEAGVIKSQIESLNQGMMELVELSIKEGLSVEESEESFQRISEEIAQLEARLEAIRTAGQTEGERSGAFRAVLPRHEINFAGGLRSRRGRRPLDTHDSHGKTRTERKLHHGARQQERDPAERGDRNPRNPGDARGTAQDGDRRRP